MGISRQQLADIIKKEMASLHTEMKEHLEALRQDTKADIASLKTEFQAEMTSPRSAQTETATTIWDIEGALTRHDSSIAGLDKTILALKQEVGKLKDRNDDLENRSRRQNRRIIGISKGVENGKQTAFMAQFFTNVLGDEITDPLALDRAHRSLAPKPKSGDRPRPMIVWLHCYADKEKSLQVSRNKGELKFRWARVHIFPDMSGELSRHRAAFTPVKAKLREAVITYALYHPAEPGLIHVRVSRSFKAPADVEEFLAKRIRPSSET